MQSTPGDRQPLEDEVLKAGQHGRGAVSHITHHMYWPIKHIQWVWPGKKVHGGCVGVYVCVCAHKRALLCVARCVLSEGWDSVLMMKDSRAIE